MNYKIFSSILFFTLLTACGSSDSKTKSCDPETIDMAVQTISPDYTSSAVALVCSQQGGIIDDLLEISNSDYTVSSGGGHFYHIGRKGVDTIAQYDYKTYSLQNWEYSTNAANEEGSSNPYKIIEASDTKAFIILYNKPRVLVVNPSANNAEDFYTDELDLSAYLGVEETSVSTSDAIIVDDKLFIAMQRLGKNYDYTNSSKIAIFDINSLSEIDSTPSISGDENAITLSGHNVQHLSASDHYLYVASSGDYGSNYGELEQINLTNYTVNTILSGNSSIGHIANVAAVNDHKVYVLGNRSGYSDGTYISKYNLYDINPENTAEKTELAQFNDMDIPDIALDPSNNLWIASGQAAKPGIYQLNTTNNAIIQFIATHLKPSTIIFK